ncbi:CBO0543 family protein [Halalkalibacter flavus]|uniref:CBO0543 family protein n=1 Tax=Halalkalibacter flavus TaxID=3090668 RepID=UPI002FC8145A
MHDPKDEKKLEEIYDQVSDLTIEKLSIWLDSVLFTWQWWIGVGLSIIPWILWFLFRQKDCTLRLLTVGFFVIFLSTFLDSLGVQLGFWYYKHSVLPLIPAFLPWDTTLMPITIMTLLQLKPKLNHYLKGLIFALATSYIIEPFFYLD